MRTALRRGKEEIQKHSNRYLEKESHYENGVTALLRFRSAVPELVDAVAG